MHQEIGIIKYSHYTIDNSTFKIISYDSSFEAITGYTPADVEKGLTQKDLITEENWEEYISLIDTKSEAYLEHSLKLKSGKKIFVFCYGRSSADGKTSDITITDVTGTRTLENEKRNIELKYNNANKELYERNFMLEKIFNGFSGGIGVFRLENNTVKAEFLTPSFYKMIETSPEEAPDLSGDILTVFSNDDRNKIISLTEKCLTKKANVGGEFRLFRSNGSMGWAEIYFSFFETGKGHPAVLGVFFDITAKKEGEIELELFNDIIKLISENKNEFLFRYDESNDCFTVSCLKNGEIVEMLRTENFRHTYSGNNLIFEADKDIFLKYFDALLATPGSISFECRFLTRESDYQWFNVFMIGKENEASSYVRILGRFTCINDEKLKQEELLKQAEMDSLTGIYNHFAFEKLVNDYKPASSRKCALFMLDIDNFKLVNDSLGHYAGDMLLKKIADTISVIFNGIGECSRLGGDEFAVFVYDAQNEEAMAQKAEALCRAVNNITLENSSLTYSVSVGICIGESSAYVNFKDLYISADYALYISKRSGRNRFHIFDSNTDIIENKKRALPLSNFDDDGYLINGTEDMVYISDLETNELLYINNSVIKNFAPMTAEEIKQKKCCELFYNKTKPCDFCTNALLSESKSYLWESPLPILGKKYLIKDRLVRWKNKKARMSTFIDVSNIKNILNVLSSRFEFEDALYSSILQIISSTDAEKGITEALSILGDYYKAERCVLFITTPESCFSNVYQWRRETADDISETLNDVSLRIPIEELEEFSNERQTIIIDDIKKLKEKHRKYYDRLYAAKIWSFYAVAIYKEEEILGYITVFNPNLHLAEITILNMLSVFLANDIARRSLIIKQEYNINHDRLTGLRNRTSYIDYTSQAKTYKSLGIVCSDINSLKAINHDFGLSYGNKVVCEIAEILSTVFKDCLVFRFGSDDFIVVCEDISLDDFSVMVGKARSLLCEHNPSAALGYAWDDYDVDFNRLYEHAEQMMLSEKALHHKSVSSVTDDNRKYVLDELLKELNKHNFVVFLQPKINMKTNEYYGAEALIRYKNEDGSIVPPVKFIPLFEKTHTISHIDMFVAEEICALLKQWKDEGLPLIPISINISRGTLLQSDFLETILALTKKYEIDKQYLELEITETLGDMEYNLISSIASRLHENGFKLSMDDFGTKYSSISMLSFMQFDSLKLDRSIVYDLCENDISYKVAKHIVSMCNDIGLECIAEGIEHIEQANALKAMDCNIAQGYLYGKPMPMPEFELKYRYSLKEKQ